MKLKNRRFHVGRLGKKLYLQVPADVISLLYQTNATGREQPTFLVR